MAFKPYSNVFDNLMHTAAVQNSGFNFHNRRSLDDAPGGEKKPNLTSATLPADSLPATADYSDISG